MAFAVVSIYGPQNVRGITGASGVVVFKALAPGAYDVQISAAGYRFRNFRQVSVAAHRVINLVVTLVRQAPLTGMRPTFTPRLRLIAVVAATPKPQVSPNHTDLKSPAARISNSLLYAMSTLPGVVMQGDNASVGGRSPAQTQVTIDGVPAGAGAPNLSLFSSDTFSEGSVDGDTGTLSFETRDPTLDWLAHVTEVQGSFDRSQFSITEGGTAGRLGISATHAVADQAGPLEGMRFLDASGLDYVHDALSEGAADTLKLRYPFSIANVLTASTTLLRSLEPATCNVFTGLVPCGYGPYDRTNSSLATSQLKDGCAYR